MAATIPFKIAGGTYANVDEFELSAFSPAIVNFYPNENKSLVKKPGTYAYLNLGTNQPVRGMFYWESTRSILAVSHTKVFKISVDDGAITDVTSAPVGSVYPPTFANDGTTVWIATGGRMVTLVDGGLTTYVNDVDAPTEVTHVAYIDGYIIANKLNSNEFHWTDAFDRSTWNALSFGNAESDPDPVVAIHVYWRQVYIFGTHTVEVWYNDGVTPFSRIEGQFLHIGCAAPYSICQAGGEVYWLNNERQVTKTNGRGISVVSSAYQRVMDEAISIVDATAVPMAVAGQGFILFNFTSAAMTLVYNYKIKEWCQWGEWLTNRYGRDRINCAIDLTHGVDFGYTLSTSTQYDGTAVDDASIGDSPWVNPSNAEGPTSNDSAYVTFERAGSTSHYLKVTNFNFNLDPKAVILGVEVIYTLRPTSGMAGMVNDIVAQLILGGNIVGENKALNQSMSYPYTANAIGDVTCGSTMYGDVYDPDATYSIVYGSSLDTWGSILTPNVINSSTFGVALAVTCNNFTYTGLPGEVKPIISVASVEIKLYYAPTVLPIGKYKILAGDSKIGKIYFVSPKIYTDDGRKIRSLARTGHLTHGIDAKKRTNELNVRVKHSVATAAQPNPSFKLSYKDNDKQWGRERQIALNNNTYDGATIHLGPLGMYVTRQYQIVHDDPTAFIFVEAVETIDKSLH